MITNILIIAGITIVIISNLLMFFVSKNEDTDRLLWCVILIGAVIASIGGCLKVIPITHLIFFGLARAIFQN